MKRTNLVCSIVMISWYTTILVGFKATPRDDSNFARVRAARSETKYCSYRSWNLELDVVTQNARRKLETQVEPAMLCAEQTRTTTAETTTQKVTVSKVGGRRPHSIERRVTLGQERERQVKVRTRKVYSSQVAKNRMKITLQIEDFFQGMPISKAMKILAPNTALDSRDRTDIGSKRKLHAYL